MNEITLNSNSREGLQALGKTSGLRPSQKLRILSGHLGRVALRQRVLGRRPSWLRGFKGRLRTSVYLFYYFQRKDLIDIFCLEVFKEIFLNVYYQ